MLNQLRLNIIEPTSQQTDCVFHELIVEDANA